LKVLLVNKFLYPRGGDAVSTIATGRLLSERGHDVLFWGMDHPDNPYYFTRDHFVSYVDLDGPAGPYAQAKTAARILYSREAKRKFSRLIRDERPDIVHLNNFAHQISPSIIPVLIKYRIPSVMTMRDYKLVCPTYLLLRDGRLCEECSQGRYYRCFLNRCTKDSWSKSLLSTLEMYLHHRVLHIYDRIDVIIATTRFLDQKCRDMGLPRRCFYLNNFVETADFRPDFSPRPGPVVYFGRLSAEKGILTLMEAVAGLGVGLKIIGEGPLRAELEARSARIDARITFLGRLGGEDLHREIRESAVVVVPSEWYEPFGRTVIEAYALGKPVIGSRMGGIPELIREGETGLTFRAGDVAELAKQIGCLTGDPEAAAAMGRAGRALVEERFGAELHYRGLISAYRRALEARR